jgi:hypothetical protein
MLSHMYLPWLVMCVCASQFSSNKLSYLVLKRPNKQPPHTYAYTLTYTLFIWFSMHWFRIHFTNFFMRIDHSINVCVYVHYRIAIDNTAKEYLVSATVLLYVYYIVRIHFIG